MNNLVLKLKMFFKNKNTVTLIAAILAIVVLYVGYNWRVNKAIKPIKVPYANVTIQPKKEITKDMISYMEIARASIKEGVITNVDDLIGYYSNVNTLIPEGSMFYKDAIVPKSELPDSSLYDVPKGETLYYLGVNMTTTYSNSMLPGNYVDIYVQTTITDVDGTNKVMVGKLISNIKILAVKTSNGLNVFENSDEARVPSTIIFSVKEDIHLLLRKAASISSLSSQYKIDIIPVPTTAGFTGTEDEEITTTITSEYIRAFIEEKSVYLPEDQISDTNPSNDKDDNGDKEPGKDTDDTTGEE